MSAEKYEPIHTALHAPTLKYYKGTFKWKTSNKLQLRCLWQIALPCVPHHCSACSSACCFSQQEKWEPPLLLLAAQTGAARGRSPRVGSVQGWDDAAGTDTASVFHQEKLCSCFPTGPTSVSVAAPQSLCCLRSVEFAVPSHGGAAKCRVLFSPAPTPVPWLVCAPTPGTPDPSLQSCSSPFPT